MLKNNFIIALVGNPNTGKTSLFNALAGQNQKVGNWAGVTVESRGGVIFEDESTRLILVDLPGLYSLRTKSQDEEVASKFILENSLALVVVVLDSSRLERSLYLYSQLKELGHRTLVILNMNDVAMSEGIFVGTERLAKIIGCPVVKTVANKPMDVENLKKALRASLEGEQTVQAPYFREALADVLEKIKSQLQDEDIGKIISHSHENSRRSFGNVYSGHISRADYVENLKNAVSLKLLEGKSSWAGRLANGQEIEKTIGEASARLESEVGLDLQTMLIEDRWNFVHGIASRAVRRIAQESTISEKIDKILLNRFAGIPIFILVMFLVFSLVFRLGKPVVSLSEAILRRISSSLALFLGARNTPPLLLSLVVDGLVNGVGTVIAFFPNIFLLFTFLGLLEDSGYFSRGTFLIDRAMTAIGLEGKSFIPLLMGFGCSVPAMMGTRILDRRRDRILTMLVIPFISCSAKLPIFVLFASVFFPERAAAVVLLLYAIGFGGVLLAAKIFSKTLLKNRYPSSLFVELPAYHLPMVRNVLGYGLRNGWEFLKSASTYIMAGILVVWGLSSLPLGVEYASEQSLLGLTGSKLALLFRYTGYGFWQAAVALIFGLMAKEIVVSSLVTLLPTGGDSLAVTLGKYFTPLSALSFLITILLYPPCISSIIVFRRETKSLGWTVFLVAYTFLTAVTVSTIFYQVGRLLHF
ncbi:MAG: ferrous iron transport protein B [Rickettsiales bacterium]|jgi:ferrous iron transport protein B|nr:ferrous iron transport protein B [Rickettsiales bacterium]